MCVCVCDETKNKKGRKKEKKTEQNSIKKPHEWAWDHRKSDGTKIMCACMRLILILKYKLIKTLLYINLVNGTISTIASVHILNTLAAQPSEWFSRT